MVGRNLRTSDDAAPHNALQRSAALRRAARGRSTEEESGERELMRHAEDDDEEPKADWAPMRVQRTFSPRHR